MKYVLNIIILFICVFLLLIVDNDYISAPVVSLDSDYYQMYDIYADNLTTKNFTKYFSDTSNFIAVYPDINLIYKEKLGNIYFECKNKFNLEDFISYYKKVLEKNNYKNDLVNIDYYGVSIKKIRVYANKEELAQILNNCTICFI